MLRFGLTPSCGNIIGNESAWQKRKQMLAGKAAAKAKHSSVKAERTRAAAVKPVLDVEAAREAEVDENPVSVDDNPLFYRLPAKDSRDVEVLKRAALQRKALDCRGYH
jgi:hypothetical protein